MKRILSFFVLLSVLISLCTLFCLDACADDLSEAYEPTYEELRQQDTWKYILLACVSTAGVIAAAIIISKKKE